MKNLKENYIFKEDDNLGNIVLYNIDVDEFLVLNETASIIFNNINLTKEQLLLHIEQNFKNIPLDYEEKILDFKKRLEMEYFHEC